MPAEEKDYERGPEQLLVNIHLLRVVSALVGCTNSCTPPSGSKECEENDSFPYCRVHIKTLTCWTARQLSEKSTCLSFFWCFLFCLVTIFLIYWFFDLDRQYLTLISIVEAHSSLCVFYLSFPFKENTQGTVYPNWKFRVYCIYCKLSNSYIQYIGLYSTAFIWTGLQGTSHSNLKAE